MWQYILFAIGLIVFLIGMMFIGYFVVPKSGKISQYTGALLFGIIALVICLILLSFFGKTLLNLGKVDDTIVSSSINLNYF